MNNWKGRHIVSIADLSKDDILQILSLATALKANPQPTLLQGKNLGTCFFEPSTRTRLSTESAMHRLGGNVLGFVDAKNTSTKKGETLEDTIRMVHGYVDMIAMRHPEAGSAARAAAVSDVPVINCGDGPNQHPTQTLLDLFTIQESQGKLDGLKIAMVGDLKYGRTVHSLTQALTHFNVELHFVAPDSLQMPETYLDELKRAGIPFYLHDTMEQVLSTADIVYMTRIQQERFDSPEEYEKMKGVYILKAAMLNNAKPNMKIMHPLPRVNEITPDVDDTRYAHYFEQAKNAVFARQAILSLLQGKPNMIYIKNVKNWHGDIVNHTIISNYHNEVIDGTGLTMLPALIDGHTHFRIPTGNEKKDWHDAGAATVSGGITTVFDMPDNAPPTVDKATLDAKKAKIHELLIQSGLPIRYKLWIGATGSNDEDIESVKDDIIGIKLSIDPAQPANAASTFKLAAKHDLVVGVHAQQYNADEKQAREGAIASTRAAITLAREHGTKTAILHVHTKEEVALIRAAKKEGISLFCEVTPPHLFLDHHDDVHLDPPLGRDDDIEALWQGLADGTIDSIGSDHQPRTRAQQKGASSKPLPGVPSIENYLALLLDASKRRGLSLEQIAHLTHHNIASFFHLEKTTDVVLVDMNKKRTIIDEQQKSKCGWSPYAGKTLTGWPVMTILRGNVYTIE